MLKDSQVDLCGRTDFTRTAPLLARDEAFSFTCAGCGGRGTHRKKSRPLPVMLASLCLAICLRLASGRSKPDGALKL